MSIYPGVSRIYTPHGSVHLCSPGICVQPASFINDVLGGRDRASLEMHFEAVIERVWRFNQRPRLSELRDALGGRDRPDWEMHLEAEIE
jgi:hypothetical protein